jgi:hypothetical protein
MSILNGSAFPAISLAFTYVQQFDSNFVYIKLELFTQEKNLDLDSVGTVSYLHAGLAVET